MEGTALNSLRVPLFIFLAALCFGSVDDGHAESLRNAAHFFDRAVAAKPTIHDISERLRIARGIDPEGVTEFSGMHEAVSFPGDTDPAQDDFRDEAYGQLRAEIRMTCAELVSARGEAAELRRSAELSRQLVKLSNTLHATGRISQPQALEAQIAWERLSDALLLVEKRAKVLAIRLNVLTGDPPENPVPPLAPLREFAATLDTRDLTEAYKSRRLFALFQQVIAPGFSVADGEELHGLDTAEVEAGAFIAAARLSLETLSLQARRYRTALIPRAEQAHKARLEGYKTGKVDFPALLEGLRELAEMRREYQAMLGEMHVLKSRVELVTGVDLD